MAGISGNIGPLRFLNTRFGQVVQRSGSGGRHDSPAYNDHISAFGEAATAMPTVMPEIFGFYGGRLPVWWVEQRSNLMSNWVKRLKGSAEWEVPHPPSTKGWVRFGAVVDTGPTWEITYSFETNFGGGADFTTVNRARDEHPRFRTQVSGAPPVVIVPKSFITSLGCDLVGHVVTSVRGGLYPGITDILFLPPP